VTGVIGAALLIIAVLSQLAQARATPVPASAAVKSGNHPL